MTKLDFPSESAITTDLTWQSSKKFNSLRNFDVTISNCQFLYQNRSKKSSTYIYTQSMNKEKKARTIHL